MANAVDNLKIVILEEGLKSIVRSYIVRGFYIRIICVNKQFKLVKDRNLVGVLFNVVLRN